MNHFQGVEGDWTLKIYSGIMEGDPPCRFGNIGVQTS